MRGSASLLRVIGSVSQQPFPLPPGLSPLNDIDDCDLRGLFGKSQVKVPGNPTVIEVFQQHARSRAG